MRIKLNYGENISNTQYISRQTNMLCSNKKRFRDAKKSTESGPKFPINPDVFLKIDY